MQFRSPIRLCKDSKIRKKFFSHLEAGKNGTNERSRGIELINNLFDQIYCILCELSNSTTSVCSCYIIF